MSNDNLRKQMGLANGPAGVEDDDGGLPWLEPAPDPDRGTLSFKSLAIIGTIFLLVFIAFLAIFYNRIAGTGSNIPGGPGGTPTLIAAPIGPFKITPEQAAQDDLDTSNDFDNRPRFSSGSEQPLAGTERLEQALREEGGGAVALDLGGSNNEPVIGYARPIRRDTQEAAEDQAETVIAKVEPQVPDVKEVAPEPVINKPAPVVEPSPPEEKAPPPPVQVASSGSYLLQLGAFSTRDSALNGWSQYSKTYPGSLAGLAPDLQSFENSAGKTLYRLRAAALDTRGAADERCKALKAAKQACFVVER